MPWCACTTFLARRRRPSSLLPYRAARRAFGAREAQTPPIGAGGTRTPREQGRIGAYGTRRPGGRAPGHTGRAGVDHVLRQHGMVCDDGRAVRQLAARLLVGSLLVRAAATGYYYVLPAVG